MSDEYLWDKSGKPDREVARLEKALGPLAHQGEWREPPRRLPRRAAWIGGGALALAAALAVAVGTLLNDDETPGKQAQSGSPTTSAQSPQGLAQAPPPPSHPLPHPCVAAPGGFVFEAKGAGEVTCGGVASRAGTLPVGTWLETGNGATVSLQVADIGMIAVREDSRLRLVETGPRQHRLELVRGSLHAKVAAPPRLFVIDTRAATAVDLGCAYDLAVDEQGRSHLRVTSGAVSLEGKGRAAHVPRGARVVADPERGPGTVVAESAAAELRAAVDRLDAGEAAAFTEVVTRSTRTDSVTLWSLLSHAAPGARAEVVRRIEQLRLRPASVRRDALLAGEPGALVALRETFENEWFREPPGKVPATLPQ